MGVAGRLLRYSPTTMLGIAFRLAPWIRRRKTHARGCGRFFGKLLVVDEGDLPYEQLPWRSITLVREGGTMGAQRLRRG